MHILSNIQTVARLDRFFESEKRARVPVVESVRKLRDDPALLSRALQDPGLLAMLMGEWLTEPKANVWFEPAHGRGGDLEGGARLDRERE